MPLRKGRSRQVVKQNIEEFHTGKTYARTKRKFGKATADKQAEAAALTTARKSRRPAGRERPKPKPRGFWN
jgi:hypothetical protein